VKNRILSLPVFVLGLCLLVLPAMAQEQPSQEEMAAMMAAMTPGPHHEALMKNVGTWDMTAKMYPAPGAPPMETKGTTTLEGMLDGRFVMETVKAPMMGMPWTGHGIYGYDNTKQKHISTWFDSFGTMMMYFEGTCENSCNVVTMYSEYMDPTTKTMKKMKSVSKQVDADTFKGELYGVEKDGTETKMMEMNYTRRK
jgi:hypothetical protein